MRRRWAVAGVCLAALSLAVAACDSGGDGGGGSQPDEETGPPQEGGTLRYGLEADGDGLNPTTNRFAIAAQIMSRAVFDQLAAWNENGEPEPYLAESFTPNDDFTQWTVTLRSGIEFQDGTPLTSEALAVQNDLTLADPLISLVATDFFDENDPYEVVDDLTIRYNFVTPVPNFPVYLTTAQIGSVASPTWLQAAEADPSLNQEPVGTGPFEFESRTIGQETTFVRNDNYWRGEGLPYLDEIQFRVQTDAQTRAQNLKAGDLDIIHTTRAADIADFREDSDVKSYEDTEGEETLLLVNTSEEPFDDLRARQALAYSTNREAYVDLIGEGVVEVANSMFSEDSVWHTDVEFPEYDPAMAQELAAEYCADNPDNCNGDKIDFTFQKTPGAENTLVADTLSSFWGDAFDVTIETVEQASFILDAATGNYQVNIWRQFGTLDPDLEYVFLTSKTITEGISPNFARNENPRIDRLLLEQRQTDDFETRKELWAQIQEELNADLPYIWLNHTVWAIVTQPYVQGVNEWDLPDGQPGFSLYNGNHQLFQIWLSN